MTKKHSSYFSRVKASFAAHKILTAIIAVTVIVGGYEIYRAKAAETLNQPQYTLSAARIGTLMQTVSGTGQVSASNQTDITSQVSGTIETINVSVGQAVHKGDLIATIDPTNALNSLQSAQLSLDKLNEPAKETDVTSAQNSVTKAYSDAYNAVSSAYLDAPDIMSGLKDLFYSTNGFLYEPRSAFLTDTARSYRQTAGEAYDAAARQYQISLDEFKNLSRSSDPAALSQMYADTYTTMKMIADAATKTQTTITYITSTSPDYDTKDASTAATNVNGWVSQANSDTSSILSAQNSIQSTTDSLNNLVTGPDQYDLQSAQASLAQAQRTYSEYFIRAPYDGIIGRIPVSVYSQAGGSTAIATIVGAQKIASISLNEVDAAKVSVGQDVNITFDAIDGLNATGTVAEVDQIGTVSQGVVAYGVKININTQDPRIKPGMSVNTSIITKQDTNVLLVPSTAVKTQGNLSYVQILDQSGVATPSNTGTQATTGTGTRRFGRTGTGTGTTTAGFGSNFASSTGGFASSTGSFAGSGNFQGTTRTMTVTSATAVVKNVPVTIGDSDDTNTVIVSGLTPGELVITRTSTGSGSTQTSAPSLLQSLGGNRAGGAARPASGANRTFNGGGAAAGGAFRIGG